PMVTMVVIILTLVFNYIPLNYAWKQWGYYFLIMISLPFIFSYSQKSSIDRYIGDLSYPIYMAHSFVILAIIAIYPANWSQQTVFGFVTVIFSIILAAIIMRYVQAPIEHIREKRVKNSGGDIIAEMLPISRELQ
ncbi:MAG: acyltransferase, partial [Sporomusa sp.]|nr:acyltransferase [Sporomusa sp.]